MNAGGLGRHEAPGKCDRRGVNGRKTCGMPHQTRLPTNRPRNRSSWRNATGTFLPAFRRPSSRNTARWSVSRQVQVHRGFQGGRRRPGRSWRRTVLQGSEQIPVSIPFTTIRPISSPVTGRLAWIALHRPNSPVAPSAGSLGGRKGRLRASRWAGTAGRGWMPDAPGPGSPVPARSC